MGRNETGKEAAAAHQEGPLCRAISIKTIPATNGSGSKSGKRIKSGIRSGSRNEEPAVEALYLLGVIRG